MAKITGVLVNVNRGTIKKLTIDNSLDGFYKALGISCIDIVYTKLGTRELDIICDDEALLKAEQIPSAIFDDGETLFGNLFICKHDAAGESISLDSAEIMTVLAHSTAQTLRSGTSYKAWFILRGLTRQ